MTISFRALGASALLLVAAALPVGTQVETRVPLPVPDIPGYRTLKADLHLHTVFSDGNVWPTVHVMEAWRDGLDVIALTDHVEYRPHVADVTTSIDRAYSVAKSAADELGIVLVPGAEITRPVSADDPFGATAHFNALFVRNASALDAPTLLEELRKAREQDAFIFWNHPGFRVEKAEWFPAIAEAYEQQLFQGVELVNGPNVYPEVFPWIEQKRLTILSNSDAHDPMPPRVAAGVRPITLIFARSADLQGIRDALVQRRTAAWMGGELWGAEEHLRALWSAAVRFETSRIKPATFALFRVRNVSALPFHFVPPKAPAWLRFEAAAIAPEADSLLRARITADAPTRQTTVDVQFELTNVHIAPQRNLVVTIPLRIDVTRP